MAKAGKGSCMAVFSSPQVAMLRVAGRKNHSDRRTHLQARLKSGEKLLALLRTKNGRTWIALLLARSLRRWWESSGSIHALSPSAALQDEVSQLRFQLRMLSGVIRRWRK